MMPDIEAGWGYPNVLVSAQVYTGSVMQQSTLVCPWALKELCCSNGDVAAGGEAPVRSVFVYNTWVVNP
jgi:hypothetical protein